MQNLKIITDKRFKNIYIQVRMIVKLEEEKVNARMILAYLLNEVSATYNTKQKLSNELDRLYGATYNASSSIVGATQVFIFKTKSIHPKYVNHKIDLVKAQCELLSEFILRPNLVDNAFTKENIAEAKRNLKNSMQRMIDDPSSYCMNKALKTAGKNYPLGCGVSDDLTAIDLVSAQEIYAVYEEMVQDLQVDVLVLGDVETQEVETKIKNHLVFPSETRGNLIPSYRMDHVDMEQSIVETKELSQSYLTGVYTTQISNRDLDYPTLRIANIIFGQIPSSLLFQELREKESLCYSIYSALNPYDGVLLVATGVDTSNIEKSKQLIEVQLKRMQTADFDDNLVDVAKKMLINSLKSSKDDVNAIFALIYRNILFGIEDSVDDMIADINKVTKEDVVRVMKQVSLITTYTLKGESTNEETL